MIPKPCVFLRIMTLGSLKEKGHNLKEKRMATKKEKDSLVESLLQKIFSAKGKEKQLLLAILKNKYPDIKLPK